MLPALGRGKAAEGSPPDEARRRSLVGAPQPSVCLTNGPQPHRSPPHLHVLRVFTLARGARVSALGVGPFSRHQDNS
jgi:hypothetical protein